MKANEEKTELTEEEKAIQLTPEQEEALLKSFEEAKMPIKMTDGKFKLGERELDIMSLSKKYQNQLLFRMLCHEVSYSRSIHQDLVDVMKLVMILLKKLGIEDIVKATEDLESEMLERYKKSTN